MEVKWRCTVDEMTADVASYAEHRGQVESVRADVRRYVGAPKPAPAGIMSSVLQYPVSADLARQIATVLMVAAEEADRMNREPRLYDVTVERRDGQPLLDESGRMQKTMQIRATDLLMAEAGIPRVFRAVEVRAVE